MNHPFSVCVVTDYGQHALCNDEIAASLWATIWPWFFLALVGVLVLRLLIGRLQEGPL